MTSPVAEATGAALLDELGKVTAFLRRDFLMAWSYKAAFFADWLNLVFQVGLFYFVGQIVDPQKLPAFGGSRASYLEFVSVGIAVTSFLQLGLGRSVTSLREEQLMGTLEPLLVTPTAPITLQLGSLMYDLLYVPVRTVIFLVLASLLLGASFSTSGLAPTLAILVAFIPFVWGLGLISAAGVIVTRRGAGLVGIGGLLLSATSSAFFPVGVFPGWLETLARLNPVTVALDSTRDALLGGEGWGSVLSATRVLGPATVVTFVTGVLALRFALVRERRRGSLGLY